jgi:hypothetical protein
MMATVSQPTGGRVPRSNRAPRASLSVSLLSRGALLGLVYEHDRNPVANRITPTAPVTDEAIAFQPDWSFANGAGQDVEQFLVDHPRPPTNRDAGFPGTWRIIVRLTTGRQGTRPVHRYERSICVDTFGFPHRNVLLSRRRHVTPPWPFIRTGRRREGDGAGLHDAA